ncbi:thiamine-phosphate kinase [Schaalia sp. lx-100]|uniref:thiamine-phosphate kinase n=1 Tax=Schaalia sp. lx-100 TaxID=2899081 RepID=UPI001E4BCABD|nr:thiamine-phosphate kinase [Schaalia sp. lx-100]MCD4556892.1 thiamine-phosphate kinase [Schaalia sp. lx-100]
MKDNIVLRVRDIDENELIARFRKVLPPGKRTDIGSGDDCAVIAAPEKHFIVTTDVLVEGRHFRTDWSQAHDIGRRAAAQNLADITAMGGQASALVVSLVTPPDISVDWLVDLVSGFGECTARVGAEVVGGDLSSGDSLVIAVTAMGYCPHGIITRSGAQVGDIVAVAGTLGYSAAGLDLLSKGYWDPAALSRAERLDIKSQDAEVNTATQKQHIRDNTAVSAVSAEEAVSIYRVPRPPVESGIEAALKGAHAMMDISDGLLIDGQRMAQASNVRIDLSFHLLEPYISALKDLAAVCGTDPTRWVLQGGEDHSLLVIFPPNVTLPAGMKPVGMVREVNTDQGAGVYIEGEKVTGIGGWDHFAHS